MSRIRAPQPSPRRLSVALAALGVVAGLAILVVPVDAAFGDDPLLRLQPFSPGMASAATEVDCGRPVGNFGRRSEGLSLYDLASAEACRDAAGRRATTAVAATAVIGLLALLGAGGARDHDMVAA